MVDEATLDDFTWFDQLVDAPEGEVIMTLAEKLRQEGREQGLKQGLEKGIEQGLEKGIEKGIEQGIEQGIVQGLERGHEQGQRTLLLKQLAIRFGGLTAVDKSRVQKASREELEKMAVRILTARNIDDVFSNDN